jgi:hypothetical protein
MELPCAPPLKLDHPYEGSISLEMNDGQNQIVLYRSPLNSVKRAKLNKLLLSGDVNTDTVFVCTVCACLALAFELLLVCASLWRCFFWFPVFHLVCFFWFRGVSFVSQCFFCFSWDNRVS